MHDMRWRFGRPEPPATETRGDPTRTAFRCNPAPSPCWSQQTSPASCGERAVKSASRRTDPDPLSAETACLCPDPATQTRSRAAPATNRSLAGRSMESRPTGRLPQYFEFPSSPRGTKLPTRSSNSSSQAHRPPSLGLFCARIQNHRPRLQDRARYVVVG